MSTLVDWAGVAQTVIDAAFADGTVITVSTRPRLPLAMGNYDLVVEARERRVLEEPINRVWTAYDLAAGPDVALPREAAPFLKAMSDARYVFAETPTAMEAIDYIQSVLDNPPLRVDVGTTEVHDHD